MGESIYGELPEEIRAQIDLMAKAPEAPQDGGYRELLAKNWQDKYRLFNSQTKLLDMREVPDLALSDIRGFIALTYSGSLISVGPAQDGSRWLEYASIKLRTDVPDIISGTGAVLSAPPALNKYLLFSKGPIQSTSSIYRIAACDESLSPGEQDRRIREAAIFLTNGFMKLNRGLSQVREPGAEQFTLSGIARYLAGKNDLSIALTKQILEDFFSTVESGFLLGERVSFGRLGHMSLKLKAAQKPRVVKNPQTKEEILIPAKPATPVPRMVFSASAKEKAASVNPAVLGGADEEDEGED
jgi:nucleoid DNA-binding protein